MPAYSVEIHERLHTLPNNAHQEEEGKDHELEYANLRILCVDDSSYNLFVLEELIRSFVPNTTIHTALNGQLALKEILENNHYDIIFLDLHMPVLDGF